MATMRAVTLRAHGGPEVLQVEELPVPEPGPGEVRIRVAAVALNHLDVWVRKGGPAFRLEYPHRLGADVVGTVDALGAGVTDVAIGARAVVQPGLSCGRCAQCLGGDDNLCRHYRLLGENAQGGYAEYLVVPRVNVAPYPATLGWAEAASAILPFITAWQMIVRKAQVTPGTTVLVQGGGSGVGVAAIQIAKLYGAKVITTVGSDAKIAAARVLGADEVINYTTTDFAAAVKQLTGKRGVDVVIDHVGGEVFAASIRAVRVGGRVVTCGATAGFHPAIDLRHIFFRQVEVLGSTMGRKADLLAVLDHVGAGRLRPVVHTVLPLAAAAEGHRLLEQRAVFGKVVLAVDPSVAPGARLVTALLDVRGLGKDYGRRTAVGAVDLAIEAGTIVGLLGPNGAGKTTTISMIAGVLTPSRGTATIAGHPIGDAGAKRALGLAPQDLALYEPITAAQNLAFFGKLYGLAGAALAERIDWALGVVGLRERAHDRVATYSGGMKRRLNLAAGVLHRPRLLVLDEPTVGVDPQSRNHIFDTVRALRDDGLAVLYTSHYMEEVEELCDRVAIMDDGAIIAAGTIAELTARHGGAGQVELELAGSDAALMAAKAMAARHGPIEGGGERLRLARPKALAPLLADVESAGATVVAMRTVTVDLQAVFLALTGQSLRD